MKHSTHADLDNRPIPEVEVVISTSIYQLTGSVCSVTICCYVYDNGDKHKLQITKQSFVYTNCNILSLMYVLTCVSIGIVAQ